MESSKNEVPINLQHPLVRVGIAGVTILLFYLFYTNYLIPQKMFLRDYSFILTKMAKGILNGFGYQVSIFQNPISSSSYFFINKNINVEVSYPCSGVNVSMLFGIIVFMFRGPLFKKFLFFILGYVLITSANIIRIAFLAINLIKNPESMEFNHKYTFNIIVYSIIFGLWWIYLNKIQPQYNSKHKIATIE